MKTSVNAKDDFLLSEAAKQYYQLDSLANGVCESDYPVYFTAFVSCYNEQELIAKTLDTIRSALSRCVPSFEIIVIDDCSSDNSCKVVEQYINQYQSERIILRRNQTNRGLAQNFIDGAFIGKGCYYKLFCGDNTVPIENIITVCGLAGQADLIIPYHTVVENKSTFRLWLSGLYTFFINLVSGNDIRYYNGGHLYKRKDIMRWHPNNRGFGFQADIACMLLQNGTTYLEVGVPASHEGVSRSLSWKNCLSIGHTILDILIRRIANVIYR